VKDEQAKYGVETGGSGGSMNRGSELLGASNGATKIEAGK